MDVHARLRALADPALVPGQERYFRHQQRFLGVRGALLHTVARDCLPADPSPEGILRASVELLGSPWMEERLVGALWLRRHERRLPPDLVDRLEAPVAATVDNWAVADTLAGGVLRRRVFRVEAERARLRTWIRSPSPWSRRIALVTYVNEARTGRHDDEILALAAQVLGDRERFVQLGLGWALRELSRADRPRVVAWLEAHHDGMSREGLRYAVEKLPPDERARVLAR